MARRQGSLADAVRRMKETREKASEEAAKLRKEREEAIQAERDGRNRTE
jgi:hypothetical protein